MGIGFQPWRTATEETGARYFIDEQDNPSDLDRFAARSIAAITAFGA